MSAISGKMVNRLVFCQMDFFYLLQFLIEAVTLSLIGGIIGIVFGLGGSYLIAGIGNSPAIVQPFSIFLAFGFAAAVGVFFGFYPARKAAQLDPIEALRYE